METTPDFPDDIIKGFNKEFKGKEGTEKRHKYEGMTKPNILSGLYSTSQYRNSWYKSMDKKTEEKTEEPHMNENTIALIEKLVNDKLENVLRSVDENKDETNNL
jgi:hypothetical protein